MVARISPTGSILTLVSRADPLCLHISNGWCLGLVFVFACFFWSVTFCLVSVRVNADVHMRVHVSPVGICLAVSAGVCLWHCLFVPFRPYICPTKSLLPSRALFLWGSQALHVCLSFPSCGCCFNACILASVAWIYLVEPSSSCPHCPKDVSLCSAAPQVLIAGVPRCLFCGFVWFVHYFCRFLLTLSKKGTNIRLDRGSADRQ